MDNSDYSRNRSNDYLGVNKIGKSIRKSPLHQPSFANPARPQSQQPQVYNINKNDFQSIVQQLTGSPSRQSQEPVPRPPHSSPKPPSMRLQRNRPSPLTPLNVTRPRMAIHHAPVQEQMPPHRPTNGVVHGAVGYNGGGNVNGARPPYHGQRQPPPAMHAPPASGDHNGWSNTAESPISAYMRYLQHSIIDTAQGPPQPQGNPQYNQNHQGQNQSQLQGQQQQQQSAGLHQYPLVPPLPSPRMNGPPPLPSHRMNGGAPLPPLPSPRMNGPPPPLPSPRMNGPPPSLLSPRMNGPPLPLPSPRMNGPPPPFPSPRMNGPPPPLPSPTSQFLLPSPSGYLNLLSPQSQYPLLSPGYQNPPPLTPNFSFSPMTQPGMFGPGPPPPPSPGMGFPSPGFFSISSPRWRD